MRGVWGECQTRYIFPMRLLLLPDAPDPSSAAEAAPRLAGLDAAAPTARAASIVHALQLLEVRHDADALVLRGHPAILRALLARLTRLEGPVLRLEAGGSALLDLMPGGEARVRWFLAPGEVERLASVIGTRGAALEVERKYLLRGLPPEAAAARSVEVRQGYLPGERLVERLRHERDAAGDRYVRTVKVGRGLARLELEEACDVALFDALWALTAGRRLTKRRHYVADGRLTWEIDEFTDRALVLAEVELSSESHHAPIPGWLEPWIVREVTDEGEYVNARLAR